MMAKAEEALMQFQQPKIVGTNLNGDHKTRKELRKVEAELKNREKDLLIFLRLRTPFMRITGKALKMPKGFLGGPPGPQAWKHSCMVFSAKLKSMFEKNVSRVLVFILSS